MAYMKKIISIVLCALLVISLASCADSGKNEEEAERWTITGRYCETTDGKSLLLSDTEGAISISPANEDDMFANLENGDEVEISVDSVEETYPGHATVYSYTLIEKGKVEDLDAEEIQSLEELGWKISFTSNTTTEETSDTLETEVDDAERQDKQEISMEHAILLAMEEAGKYYDNLQLTEIHSYDNDEDIDELAGSDGKRQWWYVNFANEEQNYVSILICDGEICNVEHFDSNGNNGLLDLSEISLTAAEAVKKAQGMGVTGGNPNNGVDWVSGYNFKMSYGSLAETPDDMRIFLEVIGISPNGNFAHVDFDAVTGEVILAEEEIKYENGEVEWKAME
jgi:hypothetical protein